MRSVEDALARFRSDADLDAQSEAEALGRIAALDPAADSSSKTSSAPPSGKRGRFGAPSLAVAALLAVVLGVALIARGGDQPSLAAEAAAAISGPEIVHMQITLGYPSSSPLAGSAPIVINEWRLNEDDDSQRVRTLVSSAPAGAPPNDEDSVHLRAPEPEGSQLTASWTPDGNGTLTIWPEDTALPLDGRSWTEALKQGYESGELTPDGKTEDGSLIFRGERFLANLLASPADCEQDVLLVDPDSLLPSELRVYTTCSQPSLESEPGVVWSIESSELPKASENLDLLMIGPWSISRVVEGGQTISGEAAQQRVAELRSAEPSFLSGG